MCCHKWHICFFKYSLLLGLYVNHEFTLPVITVIFALCRDFRQLPWFCVTAVIITKICTISTSNGQFCLNICSAFFSWARVVSSLTLLHGRKYVHTGRWPHAWLQSSFLDQTDSDTASDTGACDVITSIIRSRGKNVHNVSQSIRPINSSVGVSYENTNTVL